MRVVKKEEYKEIKEKKDFDEILDFLTTNCYNDYVFEDSLGTEIGLILGEETEDYTIYYDLVHGVVKAFDDMNDLIDYLANFANFYSVEQFVRVDVTLTYKRR